MISPRCVNYLLLAGLLALVGCAKKDPPANNNANNNQPAAGSEELIYGKWEAVDDKGIDWSVLGPHLPKSAKTMRVRKGEIEFVLGDEGPGPAVNIDYADGMITVKAPTFQVVGQALQTVTTGGPPPKPVEPPPPPKPLKLKVAVDADALTLTDEKGTAQKFKRAATVAGDVKVSGLPICCPGCGAELKKELAKVPGVSDINVDAKTKTATLKIKDADEARQIYNAVRQAGMRGAISANGKPVQIFAFDTVGGIIGAGGQPPTEITVSGVHACCPTCQEEITKLLKGAKVSFAGEGPVKTLKISGDDPVALLNELTKAGYFYKYGN
ncbi:MAG: heavy-metal-associated domain-containing protein [Gemmataceae bacterium]